MESEEKWANDNEKHMRKGKGKEKRNFGVEKKKDEKHNATSHDKRLLGIPTTLELGEWTRKFGKIVACVNKQRMKKTDAKNTKTHERNSNDKPVSLTHLPCFSKVRVLSAGRKISEPLRS